MKRLLGGIAATMTARMLAWPMVSGARPVNPASGWLLDLEGGAGVVEQDLSGDPYYQVTSLLGWYDLKLTDLDERYVAVDQSSGGVTLGLGYGWPAFYLQTMLGIRSVNLRWDIEKLSTGAKKYEMEATGSGPAFGLRLGGRLWHGEKAALHVNAFLLMAVVEEVTVNQTNVATGVSGEYLAGIPDFSMLAADGGIDLTMSWALGNFVPWASVGSRAQSTSLAMKMELLGTTTELQNFSVDARSTFNPVLGVNWNFNRHGTLWLSGSLANPSGVMTGLTLCSGARKD